MIVKIMLFTITILCVVATEDHMFTVQQLFKLYTVVTIYRTTCLQFNNCFSSIQ